MTASVNRPQQTIPDASSASCPPCPSLVYLASQILPPSSRLPCRPTAPALLPTPTLLYRQQPRDPWSMSSVWCSPPTLRQTKPSLLCVLRFWYTQGEMSRSGGRNKDPERTASASQHPCMHLPLPPASPPPPSRPSSSSPFIVIEQRMDGCIYLLSRISGTSS